MYKVEEALSLFDNQKVEKNMLEARKDAFVQYAIDGTMSYFVGNEAKSMLEHFSDQDSDGKIIKGTVAHKGKIKGKVKVIPSDYYSDFSILVKLFEEMEEGDILVAETTSPEITKRKYTFVEQQSRLHHL